METKILVNITFNAYDQLVGKDEFLAALKRDGIVVQEREKWQPAACTGQEIDIILVLINNPFVQYLADVFYGWDGIWIHDALYSKVV